MGLKSKLKAKANRKRNTVTGRKAMKPKQFGDPKNRKYRIDDKAHAANAKARATQMQKAGKLSAQKAAQIRKRADRVLAGKGK